jgi:hypothetical protein
MGYINRFNTIHGWFIEILPYFKSRKLLKIFTIEDLNIYMKLTFVKNFKNSKICDDLFLYKVNNIKNFKPRSNCFIYLFIKVFENWSRVKNWVFNSLIYKFYNKIWKTVLSMLCSAVALIVQRCLPQSKILIIQCTWEYKFILYYREAVWIYNSMYKRRYSNEKPTCTTH